MVQNNPGLVSRIYKEREMQRPHQHLRINLDELKAELVKTVGPEESKQYFYFLQSFLSLKLNKVEFKKLCLRVLGREHIPLHNQLIRAILRNACYPKSSASACQKDNIAKHDACIGVREVTSDGYQHNGHHISMPHASDSPILSNGGDQRSGDHHAALGPNWKNRAETENLVSRSAKMPVARSPDCSSLVFTKDRNELVVRNDSKEGSFVSPLLAPLGVPLCPVSFGGSCRTLPPASSSIFISMFDDGALMESCALRDRMEQIAVLQGLEGVSMDCANILNHGLDSYLEGLITSCIELVGARSGNDLTKNSANKHHIPMKLINGVKPDHLYQMQNGGAHQYHMQHKTLSQISLQDFRVAMELNPRQLGEDWPLLLEKICTDAFEE